MMKTITIGFSLPLLLLFSATMIDQSDSIGDTQLNSICSKTTNPSFCMHALKSDRRTASSDLRGLSHVSIDLALSKATSTLSHIHSLSRRASERELNRRLRSCSNYYTLSVSQLAEAKRSLGSGDYGTVVERAASAMENSENCEDEFEGGPPTAPELRQMCDEMENLCSILFEVTANMG